MFRRILAALLLSLLVSTAFASSRPRKPAKPANPAPVDFSGTWKLDLMKSKIKRVGMGATKLVISQTPQEIQIDYFNGDDELGSDVFLTNGLERQRYASRQERTYSRIQFRGKEMIVTTRGVLDISGTQQYTDTETWNLSADSKTLVNDQKDGNILVFVKDEKPEVGAR